MMIIDKVTKPPVPVGLSPILAFAMCLALGGCLPETQACTDYRQLVPRRGESANAFARTLSGERLVDAYVCGVTEVRPADMSVARFFVGRERDVGQALARRLDEVGPDDDVFHLVVALHEVSMRDRGVSVPADLAGVCRASYGPGSECERLALEVDDSRHAARPPSQAPSIAPAAGTEGSVDPCAIAIESHPAAKGQQIDVDASGCRSGVASLLDHLDRRVAWARKIDSMSLVVPRSADGSGEVERVWEAVCNAHGGKGSAVSRDAFEDAYRNSNLVRVLEAYSDGKRAALRFNSIEPFYVVKAEDRQSSQCDSRLLLPKLWFTPKASQPTQGDS